jgi:hypothetical protein
MVLTLNEHKIRKNTLPIPPPTILQNTVQKQSGFILTIKSIVRRGIW